MTFDLPASALSPEPAFVANGARLKIVHDDGRETIVRVEGSRKDGRTLILAVVREDGHYPMGTETAPQDPALWALWETRTTPDEHRMSPRRVTTDGRWQRWCSCGWQGPICDTASEARQSHGVHLANLDLFPDYGKDRE